VHVTDISMNKCWLVFHHDVATVSSRLKMNRRFLRFIDKLCTKNLTTRSVVDVRSMAIDSCLFHRRCLSRRLFQGLDQTFWRATNKSRRCLILKSLWHSRLYWYRIRRLEIAILCLETTSTRQKVQKIGHVTRKRSRSKSDKHNG
jgi:hypothetical protein